MSGSALAQAATALGEQEVHVWAVPLDHEDKRRRRALAHTAQDRILAAYLGLAPEQLEFEREPGGKPHLRGGGLQYNLSHSGQLALVALARSLPVGVDVQEPREVLLRPRFAQRICSERELGSLPDLSVARPTHAAMDETHEIPRVSSIASALLRLWVRKEAVIKARGEGSALTMSAVDVLDDEVAGGWVCRDLELSDPPGYRAALAIRATPGPDAVAVRRFQFAWA